MQMQILLLVFALGSFLTIGCGAQDNKAQPVTEYYVMTGTAPDSEDAVAVPSGSQSVAATAGAAATKSASATAATPNATTPGGQATVAPAATATPSGSTLAAGPTLALTSPAGSDVVVAGALQPIAFSATGGDPAQTFLLESSADGGTTWTMIADKVAASPYQWDVTGLPQGINYKVRVTSEDAADKPASAVTNTPFGVATAAVTFAGSFGALLKAKCDSCHATGRQNAGQFTSDNYALANIGVKDSAAQIITDIAGQKMPPGAPLTGAASDLATLWMWSGEL